MVITGRIGLSMIKKCTGLDTDTLCYDPVINKMCFEGNYGDPAEMPYVVNKEAFAVR